MGLTLNQGSKSAHVALFSKLLTTEQDKALLVEVTHNTSAEYVVGFYNIGVNFVYAGSEGEITIQLPATTTAIMKGAVDKSTFLVCQEMLREMLMKVKAVATGTLTTVKDGNGAANSPGKLPPLFDPSMGHDAPNLQSIPKDKTSPFMKNPPAPAVAKPKPGVVKLSDALAVGQKVYGTSSGSIYHAVAVNSRVKIAVRLADGKVSVRAEGKPNSKEEKALSGAGLTNHGSYWSMHLSLGGVPPARTVGALLMGLDIDFDQQLTKFKELPNEN